MCVAKRYPETYGPADILPWLDLARALDLIQEGQDSTTGRKRIRLKLRDKSGLPEPPLDLGTDLESVIRESDPANVEELKTQVGFLLKTEFLRLDKREELANVLSQRVKATAEAIGADAPHYRQELNSYKAARSILELES